MEPPRVIDRLIEWSVRNRFLVFLTLALVLVWGGWALKTTPLDAIPDVSENQVIVFTDYPGRSPQVVENQVTYPLSTGLQSLPQVKAVRAGSAFGFSMIYVIFEDAVDPYWARTRVLERLATVKAQLPPQVTPMLGPDGTGVGHVYWYTVESDRHDLGTLRSLQDWYLRYPLSSVPGVAEVASIGGFIRQYQIDLDPNKLYSYGLSIDQVTQAVKQGNNEVGGGLIEQNDAEYVVRGLGYVKGIQDLENLVLKAGPGGVPVYVKDVATVQLGPAERRGLLDKNGTGEVVGGIVVMRQGENAKAVIDRVKGKLAELQKGLPDGVRIESAYDRSDLIERAVETLKGTLIEEALIVSAIIALFLWHLRSALIIVLAIPISVLVSFILMRHLGITSNIMSLGGVAIAIGVLVDAAIVMVENAYRHLAERDVPPTPQERRQIILESARQVGRPIFFSLLIILLSFAPVFLLEGEEGKLFKPLAFTKSFAMAGAALLSVTLVPVLMTLLLNGRMRPEAENPLSRYLMGLYRPVLAMALRFKKATLAVTLALGLVTAPVAASMGKEFMPALDEGSLLFMPVTLPTVSVTEAKRILQLQDALLKEVPEVQQVLGKAGRAETATDPAPVSMIETIVLLKPASEWRPGMTKDRLIEELDRKVQIPGVTNGWTQPIINRINMLATGVRSDLGVKIYGPDLRTLEHLAVKTEELLRTIPGAADVYAERVIGGRFIDIEPDREAAARYGVSTEQLQMVIEAAIGGNTLTTTVEGRERYPVRVRYARDFKDSMEALSRVLVPTASGAQLPLSEMARLRVSEGPPMINSENSQLRSLVYVNVRGRDMGGFVDESKRTLESHLALPEGYHVAWSGRYEHQIRASERLKIVVPAVLLIIFILLFVTFRSVQNALLVLLSVPFALIGGVWLQKFLGFHFSVAVWVGYIALAGVAVETGVVMLIYLNEALDRRLQKGRISAQDIVDATLEGAVLRLRPKLMTVAASLLGLVPIMWSHGTGADVMRPIATPLIGGLVTSALLVLVVLPVVFALLKEWERQKGVL